LLSGSLPLVQWVTAGAQNYEWHIKHSSIAAASGDLALFRWLAKDKKCPLSTQNAQIAAMFNRRELASRFYSDPRHPGENGEFLVTDGQLRTNVAELPILHSAPNVVHNLLDEGLAILVPPVAQIYTWVNALGALRELAYRRRWGIMLSFVRTANLGSNIENEISHSDFVELLRSNAPLPVLNVFVQTAFPWPPSATTEFAKEGKWTLVDAIIRSAVARQGRSNRAGNRFNAAEIVAIAWEQGQLERIVKYAENYAAFKNPEVIANGIVRFAPKQLEDFQAHVKGFRKLVEINSTLPQVLAAAWAKAGYADLLRFFIDAFFEKWPFSDLLSHLGENKSAIIRLACEEYGYVLKKDETDRIAKWGSVADLDWLHLNGLLQWNSEMSKYFIQKNNFEPLEWAVNQGLPVSREKIFPTLFGVHQISIWKTLLEKRVFPWTTDMMESLLSLKNTDIACWAIESGLLFSKEYVANYAWRERDVRILKSLVKSQAVEWVSARDTTRFLNQDGGPTEAQLIDAINVGLEFDHKQVLHFAAKAKFNAVGTLMAKRGILNPLSFVAWVTNEVDVYTILTQFVPSNEVKRYFCACLDGAKLGVLFAALFASLDTLSNARTPYYDTPSFWEFISATQSKDSFELFARLKPMATALPFSTGISANRRTPSSPWLSN